LSIGLIALLDDVAAIAKVAAASLDDIVGQAAKAGAKAAGVVIDDTAVTPRYVVGFSSERELPIVYRIALGSLRNKLLILLPAALALSYFLPSAVTPLLMIGGAYLCYEGAEKVFEALLPHAAHAHEAELGSVALDPKSLEDEKIAGAIKTDFILSAEIMAIALASIPEGTFISKALILAVVGIGITVAVYGAVALLVKADDAGVMLAANQRSSVLGMTSRGIGRVLVLGMPVLLKVLSIVGTAAMVWVGGGIIVHGLDSYQFSALHHAIHDAAVAVAHAVPMIGGFVEWLAEATGAGVVGLAIGAALIPLVGYVFAPAWKAVKALLPRRPRAA
jgi:predicted DNA repair protein MutK